MKRSILAVAAALVAIFPASNAWSKKRVTHRGFAVERRCLDSRCYRTFAPISGEGRFEFYTKYRPEPGASGIVLVMSATLSDRDHATGCYVSHGSVKRTGRCGTWDAAAVLNVSADEPVVIIGTGTGKLLTEKYLKQKATAGRSLFQSIRLVEKGRAENFAGNASRRLRALAVMKDKTPMIVASADPVTLDQFTADLVRLGVQDAVYLDINDYDAGWYRDPVKWDIKSLGTHPEKTKKQTNWLVLKLN